MTAHVLTNGQHDEVLPPTLPVVSDITGHFSWNPAMTAYPASKTPHEASHDTTPPVNNNKSGVLNLSWALYKIITI